MSDDGRTPLRPLPHVSVAFGGGGPFGIAYRLGVAHALADAGFSFDDVDMVGTSAGAWVAACLVTGVGFAELCSVPQIRIPSLRPGLLQGIATGLFADARSARVTASAVRMTSGRRALLRGVDHPLADMVAASSAVPGVFSPVRVGRRWYVDGGVRSLVSAHEAAPAHHLLVVAPIAGPMFGPGGRAMDLMLRDELRRWQRATGGQVHVVRPNADVARLARHPLQLFDKARAQAAYPLAYAQGRHLAQDRPALLEPPTAPAAVA